MINKANYSLDYFFNVMEMLGKMQHKVSQKSKNGLRKVNINKIKNPAQKKLKQDFVLRSNNYFLVANA